MPWAEGVFFFLNQFLEKNARHSRAGFPFFLLTLSYINSEPAIPALLLLSLTPTTALNSTGLPRVLAASGILNVANAGFVA